MTCASRSSRHWRRPWSAAGSASRSTPTPPPAVPMPHPRHWPAPDGCGVVAQDPQLGDGRREGLCSSATRLGRSARRVTGRSRCWAVASRRRPIAWSLGRSVADDLGAQQPRHLGAVPDRPGGPRCPSRRHGQRLGGRGGPPGRPRPPRRPGPAGRPDHPAPAHRRRHRPCWSPTAGGQDLGHPCQGLLAERPRQPPRRASPPTRRTLPYRATASIAR
jgi:hypothetical protein